MLRTIARLLILMPGAAWAQDVERGQELAVRWCANCHVVGRTADAASANGLPTFPAIAASPRTTPESLRAKMTAQHGRMPDLSLSRRQQDDLVAYILNLRQK
jgi:mono/diheme cytochrome c family protein